ncbi:MAG TPA: hypothetical protein VI548_03385 [Chitinophagaceae bacterium]|nr:hypothetical protein [Chitinophagaceae bacterium]
MPDINKKKLIDIGLRHRSSKDNVILFRTVFPVSGIRTLDFLRELILVNQLTQKYIGCIIAARANMLVLKNMVFTGRIVVLQ